MSHTACVSKGVKFIVLIKIMAIIKWIICVTLSRMELGHFKN